MEYLILGGGRGGGWRDLLLGQRSSSDGNDGSMVVTLWGPNIPDSCQCSALGGINSTSCPCENLTTT